MAKNELAKIKHPAYILQESEWQLYRDVYKSGQDFLDKYLEKFSKREDNDDFTCRKNITPIPAFARAAVQDIKASLFQRMASITRVGGSSMYQKAVKGEGSGVDNRGSGMNAFIGMEVLEDLLVIGKVGVYIDAPATSPNTLVDADKFKPYLYHYAPEDILSWLRNDPEHPSEFQAVLLRETESEFDEVFGLPTGTTKRLRYVWISPLTGKVNVQFYSPEGKPLSEPTELELTRIPFVLLDIKGSLLKDVARHQIALLNIWSSTVAHGVTGSFPMYVEQRDSRDVGAHLKHSANADGTATAGGQGAADETIEVGSMKGRYYDLNAEAPSFINPSVEPLEANIKLCEKLQNDIRALVNLAVTNLGSQVSAESRNMENAGLESGLSFIGLVLETAEREIAKHWASYESTIESERQVATISYPERWSLQSKEQRIKEASDLYEVATKIPGRTIKKATSKLLVTALLGNQVAESVIEMIHKEIDKAEYTTSDPEIIRMAKEQGFVGDETGSIALGFSDNEYKKAQQDHIKRLEEIQKAQTPPGEVQGVPDTAVNANATNKGVKAQQKSNPNNATTKPPVRGEGKAV